MSQENVELAANRLQTNGAGRTGFGDTDCHDMRPDSFGKAISRTRRYRAAWQ
jgi:hypothetical protein